MKFIIGEKINMGQFFDEGGRVSPVTFIKTKPLVVTQIKTMEVDGYDAVQVGFKPTKESKTKKPQAGHTKGNGFFAKFKEFKTNEIENFKVGDKIEISNFEAGDKVQISGLTKGKGFQGVVKRHGFHGGPRSHGQKHSEREPGSIGGGPGRAGGRVIKGMRMAGRMGGDRVTVKKLEIKGVVPEENLLIVAGSIPGRRGTILEITSE